MIPARSVNNPHNYYVEFDAAAFSAEQAAKIFFLLEELFLDDKENKEYKISNKNLNNSRINKFYGTPDLKYPVTVYNKTTEYTVQPWSDAPVVKLVKDLIEPRTQEVYDMCSINRYPHGNIGIGAHRDKEIGNKSICGVSFGATRRLTMRRGEFSQSYDLNSGSLYIIRPPTNRYYTHEIEKDPTVQGVRYSLTFRDSKG